MADAAAATAAISPSPHRPACYVPNLRKLIVPYKEGCASAAEMNVLCCLPALQVLKIGWWASGSNCARCSYCSCTADGSIVGAPDFGNEDLNYLLAGLLQLRRLSFALRPRMTADTKSLACRRCLFLEHVELRGSRPLPALPLSDAESCAITESCLCCMRS